MKGMEMFEGHRDGERVIKFRSLIGSKGTVTICTRMCKCESIITKFNKFYRLGNRWILTSLIFV